MSRFVFNHLPDLSRQSFNLSFDQFGESRLTLNRGMEVSDLYDVLGSFPSSFTFHGRQIDVVDDGSRFLMMCEGNNHYRPLGAPLSIVAIPHTIDDIDFLKLASKDLMPFGPSQDLPGTHGSIGMRYNKFSDSPCGLITVRFVQNHLRSKYQSVKMRERESFIRENIGWRDSAMNLLFDFAHKRNASLVIPPKYRVHPNETFIRSGVCTEFANRCHAMALARGFKVQVQDEHIKYDHPCL